MFNIVVIFNSFAICFNMCLFIYVLFFFSFLQQSSTESMSNIFVRSAYYVVEGRKLYPRLHGMNFEVESKVGR